MEEVLLFCLKETTVDVKPEQVLVTVLTNVIYDHMISYRTMYNINM